MMYLNCISPCICLLSFNVFATIKLALMSRKKGFGVKRMTLKPVRCLSSCVIAIPVNSVFSFNISSDSLRFETALVLIPFQRE